MGHRLLLLDNIYAFLVFIYFEKEGTSTSRGGEEREGEREGFPRSLHTVSRADSGLTQGWIPE